MEKFTHSRLVTEILTLLEKGDKSTSIIQERMKNPIRELVIEPILRDLESEGLIRETERLPERRVWGITKEGKKLVEEEKAKTKQSECLLEED